MANEQTSVPLYAASEVLTAANMNISAGTGVPVFATTVTRDAAFGGANEKVLAEGQLCYLSATNVVQYYDGAAWATVGPAAASGLVCVKAETAFTSATTVNVNNVFSATYTNYLVISTFIGTTGDDLSLRLRVGGVDNSTASSYVRQGTQTNGSTLSGFRSNSAQTKFGSFNTSGTSFAMFQFCNPFSATTTNIYGNFAEPGAASTIDSQYTLHNAASSFDGFSLLCLSTGNVTGSFTVYGYSKTV